MPWGQESAEGLGLLLQGLPCSVGMGRWRGSPALGLQWDHSFLQQTFVYVRLQEPWVGVLQETVSSLTLPFSSQLQAGIAGATFCS